MGGLVGGQAIACNLHLSNHGTGHWPEKAKSSNPSQPHAAITHHNPPFLSWPTPIPKAVSLVDQVILGTDVLERDQRLVFAPHYHVPDHNLVDRLRGVCDGKTKGGKRDKGVCVSDRKTC